MKQTNFTAYGTVGCRIELTHADMYTLGREVANVKEYLNSKQYKECKEVSEETGGFKKQCDRWKSIEKLVSFLDKFIDIPAENSNVFGDSPLDFKRIEQKD